MQHTYSDEQLISAILEGGKSLEEAINWLYHQSGFQMQATKMVKNYGGSSEDAEDVFQEALTALTLNIRRGRFNGDSRISTYFYNICKNCWYSKFEKKQKQTLISNTLEQPAEGSYSPEDLLILTENQAKWTPVLARLGHICQQILSLWMVGYNMTEIAEKVGYKNAGVVSKKKHGCVKDLKELASAEPEIFKK